jgi:glycosyltransferase involved in cell wall biosynthesis
LKEILTLNNPSIKKDSVFKIVLRLFYRFWLGIYVFITTINFKKIKKTKPKVFFGGARSGNYGGPLVKVKRLKQEFSEFLLNYNLLYVLSNAPYLPESSYKLVKKKKIPIVLNQNGVFYEAWYQGDWQHENTRMSVPYHLADYVFYQSKFCEEAANKYLGKRKGDSEILYNAVNTALFKPNKELFYQKDTPFIFLLTGRINKHLYYRVESTIKALAAVIKEGLNAKLIISGGLDYDVTKSSKELINELKINNSVKFTGPYKQEDAPSIYNYANAYIMTKHNDPCPNTVIEALSCGLPVLYSHSGGVPELVGNDAGIALECKESWKSVQVPCVKDICDGMLDIANRYEEMSNFARNRAVEKFDIKKWIKRHKIIFEKLLRT